MSVVFRLKFEDDDAAAKVKAIEGGIASATKETDRARDAMGKFAKAGSAAGEAVAKSGEDAAKGLGKTTNAADHGADVMTRLNGLIAATNAELIHTKQAAEPAANSFADLVEQMDREARVVERIRGPMREYEADMQALERLMEKGTLTAIEYNDEIDRLIKKHGTMQGPTAPPPPPVPKAEPEAEKDSTIGSAIVGLAAGGGLVAAAHQLEEIVHQLHEMEDWYIRTTNAARKFEDSTHSVNVVVNEQVKLAHELQSDLGATLEAYDSVRDGTDELALSHREQIQLTKSLGEAVQISGKSLEQAGGIMSRLSYAMAAGKIETRELKGIMKEVPDIASLWTHHFNVSRQSLLALVQSGKIGVNDLMMAMVQDTKELQANFDKRQVTNEQLEKEFALRTKIAYQRNGGNAMDAVQEANSPGSTALFHPEQADKDRWEAFVGMVSDTAGDMTARLARFDQEGLQMIHKSIKELTVAWPTMVSEFNKGIDGILQKTGVMSDAWGSDKTGFGAQVKLLTSIKGPINDAKQELENLNAVHAAGTINAEEYRQKYDALMTVMNDGRLPEAIRLWEAIREPQKAFHRGTEALHQLLATGMITLHEYSSELKKLSEIRFGPELTKLLDFTDHPIKPNSQASDYAKYQADVAHEGVIGDKTAALEKQYKLPDGPDLAADLAALEKRNDGLRAQGKEIAGLDDVLRTHNEQLKLELGYAEAIKGPQELYQNRLVAIGDLLHVGTINAEQYNRMVDGARAAYLGAAAEGKNFAGAMEQQWLKMKADAESVGQTIATSVIGDLDKLNEALITTANGGEVAWGKMADAMIQDLERILVKQLEVLAITALLNLIAPGSGTAASSSGVTGAIVDKIPGAANGFQGVVGGTGGTDSQLAQFRVTPGETVTIQTPEQRRADAGSQSDQAAASASPVVNVHNHVDESVMIHALTSKAGERAIINMMRKINGGMKR